MLCPRIFPVQFQAFSQQIKLFSGLFLGIFKRLHSCFLHFSVLYPCKHSILCIKVGIDKSFYFSSFSEIFFRIPLQVFLQSLRYSADSNTQNRVGFDSFHSGVTELMPSCMFFVTTNIANNYITLQLLMIILYQSTLQELKFHSEVTSVLCKTCRKAVLVIS